MRPISGPFRAPTTPVTIPVSGGCPVSSTWAASRQGSDFARLYRRRLMHRLTSAMCWLVLGAGLAPAFGQPTGEAQKKLQGTWAATTAERDGKAADDVVGHRLSFIGNRFRIQSRDGKPLYAGTFLLDPSTKPA